ncbi:hypothetical protein ACKAV7_006879 [Fusarium commune]
MLHISQVSFFTLIIQLIKYKVQAFEQLSHSYREGFSLSPTFLKDILPLDPFHRLLPFHLYSTHSPSCVTLLSPLSFSHFIESLDEAIEIFFRHFPFPYQASLGDPDIFPPLPFPSLPLLEYQTTLSRYLTHKKCVKKLVRGEPLQAASMDEYKAWKAVKKHLQTAMELQDQTGKPACIPAPHLVSVIVLLTIRHARINTNKFAEDNQPFMRLFGHYHMSQWLPIAIKFYEQMHNEPFILEINQNANEPVLDKKTQDGNEVWVVYASSPSPFGPHALPAQIMEQIKGLETHADPDFMMGGHYDVCSGVSNDPSEGESIFVTATTTRAEALKSGAEVLGKLDQPDVDQASLKLGMDMWLSEPHIRVMTEDMKHELFFWCEDYSPSWCELIKSCVDDELEAWSFETEVHADSKLNIPKGGGSNFLRLYGQLANKAFLLKSSNPSEARRLMDRVSNGINLFAAKSHEKEVSITKAGDIKSRLVEVGKGFEGIADAIEQMDVERRANKADIAELWSMLVQQTGNVPDCLRRIALANCTPKDVQKLEATIESDSEDSSCCDLD